VSHSRRVPRHDPTDKVGSFQIAQAFRSAANIGRFRSGWQTRFAKIFAEVRQIIWVGIGR
jgi:hypothetical protein